jgi:hypothetical protein
MLGKAIVDGLGLINVNLKSCPYQMLTFMGRLEKAQKFTKQEIVIQFNSNKPTYYAIMHAQTMVMHVTSYDILVGGAILYCLKIKLDFCEETTYYQLGWANKS